MVTLAIGLVLGVVAVIEIPLTVRGLVALLRARPDASLREAAEAIAVARRRHR